MEDAVRALGVRQKMLVILLTVLLCAVGLSSAVTLQSQQEELYRAVQLRGEEVVKHAANALALYAVSYDYQSIQLLLDELIDGPQIEHAHVTSAKGNIMATAGPPALESGQRPTFSRDIRFDDRVVGRLTLELDDADIVRRVTEARNDLLLRELLLVIAVAVAEFLALSYLIARPLEVMDSVLARNAKSEGHIPHRIPLTSRDEFGRLATHFNTLRDRFNDTQQQLRSRVEAADAQLVQTNQTLRLQSEKLRKANRRLVELSLTDSLTGLYNRRHFEDVMIAQLEDVQADQTPCSLLLIDVDHFKRINDTFGHSVGDAVLRHFGRLLQDGVRQNDVACRVGGEEFAIACKQTDGEDAFRLAERLRAAAEARPFIEDATRVPFTVSVGIATARQRPARLDDVFRQADEALYTSKQQGRNRVTRYSPDIDTPLAADHAT